MLPTLSNWRGSLSVESGNVLEELVPRGSRLDVTQPGRKMLPKFAISGSLRRGASGQPKPTNLAMMTL